MDYRRIAEFAGIDTRNYVLVAYRDKDRWEPTDREQTDDELKTTLLSPAGSLAIMEAFLREDIRVSLKMGGDGTFRCDYNGLSPRWEGTSNWHPDLPSAILSAAWEYVKEESK